MQFATPYKSKWEKWRRVAADVLTELPRLNACHDKLESCTPAERRFVQIVIEAEAQLGIGRIEVINRRINGAIQYTPDKTQWGVADRWTAPFATDGQGSFETGKGDCEDYAAAKFVALHLVGVPPANMRLVLVRDKVVHLVHAILAVHHEKRWLILDNCHYELYEDKVYNTFTPLAVVDSEGVGRLSRAFVEEKLGTPCAG
jgi:predicted transglutaminase-like cysteine proteinase